MLFIISGLSSRSLLSRVLRMGSRHQHPLGSKMNPEPLAQVTYIWLLIQTL